MAGPGSAYCERGHTQVATISQIRSRLPYAKVVVVGYPRIFNGEDCNAFTWFSPAEQSRLNQTADLLDTRLATAASAAGFSFANPTSRFIGHAVCADDEWINEPETFVAPDLTTPEARRDARRAGIDIEKFLERSARAAEPSRAPAPDGPSVPVGRQGP